jgi:homoserine O-acetyltransferase
VEKALRSIKVPFLYMPSETDLYFPLTDARYEAQFIANVSLVPIPSLWGHTAGAGSNPEDEKFLNDTIGKFLRAEKVGRGEVRHQGVGSEDTDPSGNDKLVTMVCMC